MLVLSLIGFFFGPGNGHTMNDLVSCLGNPIIFERLDGAFHYSPEGPQNGIYRSSFFSLNGPSLGLVQGVRDSLICETQSYLLPEWFSLNPLGTTVFTFNFSNCSYLCLVGQSQSASGTGVQMTNYAILKKNALEPSNLYLSRSRFGTITSLGDFDSNGHLDLLQVRYDNSDSDFVVTTRNLPFDPNEQDRYPSQYFLKVKRVDNGRTDYQFVVKEQHWFHKVDCQ